MFNLNFASCQTQLDKLKLHTITINSFFLPHTKHIPGYPDLYLMKLVNSHVMTIPGVGDVMESEMMHNEKFSSVPHGPCVLLYRSIIRLAIPSLYILSSLSSCKMQF